jgi:cobalamin-dependent methionine synthase I
MAKFITIGERIQCMDPAIRVALNEMKPEAILDRAKAQLDGGATYLDVNIGPAEANGPAIMKWAVQLLQDNFDNVPLALDTVNRAAIEAGLSVYNRSKGKPIVNSADAGDRISNLDLAAANDAICIALCSQDAIVVGWDESAVVLNRKIAEYTKAVVDGRPCFHIALVIDVSPNCDCHSENDAAIIPNVGMFASFDPVALDMACVDAVNAQPALYGSAAADGDHDDHDHFHRMHPDTDWEACLAHAEKLGLGSREYELVKI